MDEKSASVEENIILATINCIDQYGISGATNRQIAKLAGVNLAAINYYFRSKETLIQRCMEITLKNAFNLRDIPPVVGSTPQDHCIEVMMHLFEGGLRYPGITRAHFYNLLVQGQPDLLLKKYYDHFIDELADELMNRKCALAPEELEPALIQITSSVFMMVLAPDLFEQKPGYTLRNPDTYRACITRLVNRLL